MNAGPDTEELLDRAGRGDREAQGALLQRHHARLRRMVALRMDARLAARDHPALPMNRFRPNIVIAGAAPYAEDGWLEVAIGDAVFRAAKPCGRCQVTTTDQSTGEVRGPEPLQTLGMYRDDPEFGVIFGMNWAIVKQGRIRVGDEVRVLA